MLYKACCIAYNIITLDVRLCCFVYNILITTIQHKRPYTNANLYIIENTNTYLSTIKVLKIEIKLNHNEEVASCGHRIQNK